ncbi:tyrosine-type recombinase/integrase (plasmid) [Methylomonas sp. 2BW1-5-20]|uniref:tyrosine-type recombinase/integrase n=1 Tax=Methylomonas sp. 2BW1-5-20 TaxID=3376686 RepID=UPI00404D3164
MNLDDLFLLRGWINQIPWSVLDEQRSEGGEPARRRLKTLRRDLAKKARFYDKPDIVALWLSQRQSNETWSKQAERALNTLNRLPEPVPAGDQELRRWLPEKVCATLPVSVTTWSEAINWLEEGRGRDRGYPAPLRPAIKVLTGFLSSHAEVLGYQPKSKPPTDALPMPLHSVAPLEQVLIPIELNGEQGSNRSTELCRIEANHDLAAIHSWLALKDDNPKTYQAYKKELERLLLWAILERGRALSSLNTDDCRAYIQFLKNLTTADQRWVTQQPANKHNGKWKPFYYRAKKTEVSVIDDATENEQSQPVLSAKSINYAKTVISSCMAWLVKQHYLKHNNFEDMPNIKFAHIALQTANRAFTLSQMQFILAYAQAKIKPGSSTEGADRRLLFILKFAFYTGLRLQELAAASFGDIEYLEDDNGLHYFLRVVGKHSKLRKTSMPSTLIEELQSYLRKRGCPSQFERMPPEAPLIPSLRDPTARKHLSPAGLHKTLAEFFDQLYFHLNGDPESDLRLVSKIRKASAHWLRHSYGSYLANDKQVPLTYIRDELGHADISTTSLYLNTDAKQRQKVVSEAFSAV